MIFCLQNSYVALLNRHERKIFAEVKTKHMRMFLLQLQLLSVMAPKKLARSWISKCGFVFLNVKSQLSA